jgi:NADPH-dependent 2,4-dienoyl-CoA reductase/sulfur reductase-like enzyme/nitrite reductase/ring-hydroxylating ferredoxin subunit
MGNDAKEPTGPDLAAGIPESELQDGAMLVGHALGEPVLLARVGEEFFAIGAQCTHYSGPLGEGLLVGDTVRCPWHHACFSLRTGEALRAPAFAPVQCWRVERRDGTIRVAGKAEPAAAPAARAAGAGAPASIVIIGAGAAGIAAAEMLRRRGYSGRLVMIGADADAPYDRPNLSKDYLAGDAQEEWLPLFPAEFYEEKRIELVLGTPVAAVGAERREVRLADGRSFGYDRLLLATGAEPIHLDPAIHAQPKVFTLRSLADCRDIIGAAEGACRAVVVGSSFIGLEVAASLRKRGLEVEVVTRDAVPFERVLGAEIGRYLQGVHEAHGVIFHLEQTVTAVDGDQVTLGDGRRLQADLVVVGVGVRPALELARSAGLDVDGGVVVNEYLETSRPGVFAAGDIASWPDPRTGRHVRVEHWVVAERLGQAAAHNMLGERRRFADVPFFWTWHHEVGLNYTGHHGMPAGVTMDGSLEAGSCLVAYRNERKIAAVATIGRDGDCLRAEEALERKDEQALERLAGGG